MTKNTTTRRNIWSWNWRVTAFSPSNCKEVEQKILQIVCHHFNLMKVLWSKQQTQQTFLKIKIFCRQLFFIIQSNPEYCRSTLSQWFLFFFKRNQGVQLRDTSWAGQSVSVSNPSTEYNRTETETLHILTAWLLMTGIHRNVTPLSALGNYLNRGFEVPWALWE